MAAYTYTKPGADLSRLQSQCLAAGLPVDYINGSGDDVIIFTTRDLDAAELAQLAGLVEAHDGRPLRPRLLAAILADLQALTAPKQAAVWADLTGGTPAKWRTMSSDPCVWAKASQGTTSALEKQVAVAFFVREFPAYLVAPAFDPSISIPGDEPFTP